MYHAYERERADATQIGMGTPWIVEAIDVMEDSCISLVAGRAVAPLYPDSGP